MVSKWMFGQFYRFFLWFFLCCLVISSPAHANTTQAIPTVRLGVLPDSDKQLLKQRFIPLVQYIEANTGLIIELIIPKNHEDLAQGYHLDQPIEKSEMLKQHGSET